MHFILPYFIIILVVIQLLLKKSDNSQQNKIKQFWEREQKANATRKQDISNLNYVKWDEITELFLIFLTITMRLLLHMKLLCHLRVSR